MYNNFDFKEMEKASREQLAKIYSDSLRSQEYLNEELVNETYKKVRKILECPEMEKCHPYLYSLDMDDFNDEDVEKINKIYDLGVNRGMIQKDGDEEDDAEATDDVKKCDYDDTSLCGGPEDSITSQPMNPQPMQRRPIYTVMYSAQKDGYGTMGQFYSMAQSIEGAKEDCVNQMTANGYDDIMIMAVDQNFQGVEDDITDNVDHSLDNVSPNGVEPDAETIKEDDSEEYLKQETGDESSDSDSKGTTEGNGEGTAEGDAEEKQETSENDDESEDKNAEGDEESVEETPAEDNSGEEETEDGENQGSEDGEEEEEEKERDADNSEETEDGESENTEETKDEETTEDEEEPKEEKLTAEEKTAMATIYTKTFKEVLKKTGLEKSVDDMTLEERTDFYQKLSEKWDKNDPSDFMTDKDQEKLNKLVVKSEGK